MPDRPDAPPSARDRLGRLRPRLRHLRLLVLVAVALSAVALGHAFVTADAAQQTATAASPSEVDATLVVTVDATGPGQIIAYDADGSVAYRNRTWGIYHDVDPVPGTEDTVEYVASGGADDRHCSVDDWCRVNVVERLNLSTDEVRRVHTWVSDHDGSSQIHDVDRVNESVLLVGDIRYPDNVFMLNTTTDEVIWRWNVSAAFEPSSGGNYPPDWTHLNDVEYLPDGRVMVNLRNQDQVVFVEPGEGVQHDWTLGADGSHGTLYEQHNADYVPESEGGPAVIVADSENNRLVEYQRADGDWERTWRWADTRLQWPRDADRRPDGSTLVVDSHGSRLLEVAPDGSVAWSEPFPDGGYDAELLDSADESDGPSARRAGLESSTPDTLRHHAVSLVPALVLHGALYVLPVWVDALHAVVFLATGVVLVVWLLVELGVRVRPLVARVRERRAR